MPQVQEVSASEFRQNFGKYMKLVATQDFRVTRNGKTVGLWSNPNRERMLLADELAGSIHAHVDEDADKAERTSAA